MVYDYRFRFRTYIPLILRITLHGNEINPIFHISYGSLKLIVLVRDPHFKNIFNTINSKIVKDYVCDEKLTSKESMMPECCSRMLH